MIFVTALKEYAVITIVLDTHTGPTVVVIIMAYTLYVKTHVVGVVGMYGILLL